MKTESNSHIISNKSILTVGCSFKNPKGGIAQVLNTYSKYVFQKFNCIINSTNRGFLTNVIVLTFSYIQTLLILIFNPNIRIIHIHTASYRSFQRSSLWVNLAKFFKKKVILHIHGGAFKEYYKTNPTWIQSVLNKCDCIITLSNEWKNFFTSELKCKNVRIIPNIVPYPSATGIIPDDKFHLLFLGLITENKGIFDLLDVLKDHKSDFQDKLILHIGGNGKIAELKEFIKNNSLESIVKYEGFVSGNRKTELFNIANAFILPSYIEGLPISILEAMSYSLPILSTNVGGIPEIVENDRNGILFSPGDQQQMEDSIAALMNNPQRLKEMGTASHDMIEKFLPNSVSLKLSEVYNELLKL